MSKDITETRISIRPDDGELKNYADQRHRDHIFSPFAEVQANGAANPNNGAVMTQLTASISQQAEEIAEANKLQKEELQLRKDREENKKDRLKNLHPSIKNMLTNASPPYCDDEEEEYVTNSTLPDLCLAFFNFENVGTANQELVEQFRELRTPEATYSQATVQALMVCHFLYQSGLEPSNFTACGFNEETPTLASEPNRTLLLYLAATQGRRKTLEEISCSTKQWVKAPTIFKELAMQLVLLMGISTIFFSAESALVPSVNTFHKSMTLNKTCIRTRIASDKLYASKFLYATVSSVG